MLKKANQEAVSRSPTVDKTIDSIREKIFMQQYKSGTFLAETHLAEEYQISRASVRSALFVMEKEGLIVTQPNGRKMVLGINERYVDGLYNLRKLLECEAIKYCINGQNVNYSRLAVAITEFYTTGNPSPEERYRRRAKANTAFHRTLVEISEERPLLQCWDTIESSFMAISKINYDTLGDNLTDKDLVRVHTDLLELIIAKDENASMELTKHIMVAKKESIEGLKKLVWL